MDTYNTGTFTDLQTDVNEAKGNLDLAKDYNNTDNHGSVIIDNNIVINGNGHIIDANGKYNVFTINKDVTVSFINIQFINCKAEYGGALYNQGDLTTVNCKFINNKADYGGAIYTGGNICNIINSTFINTSATCGDGGAIYSEKGTVFVLGSTFINTSATYGGGGAIANDGDDVFVSGSTFINISATGSGGAIYGLNSVSVINSTFNYTQSSRFGGSIYGWDNVKVFDSKFANNKANKGNDIYSRNCVTLISNVYGVKTIYATKDVVGNNIINLDGTFAELQYRINITPANSVLNLENKKYIASEKDNTIVINENIIIDGHGATIDGNNKFRIMDIASDVRVTLINITFINGKAVGNGGAIMGEYRNSITVLNSKFINNTASYGGGAIAIYRFGNVDVSNSEFINDTAYSGGAIYSNYYSNIAVENSIFNNTSATNGGAISGLWSGNIIVSDSTLTNIIGETGSYGGTIYSDECNVIVTNSTFDYPQSFTELQTIVDSANNGDTIYLNGRIVNQSLGGRNIIINKNIIIDGGSKYRSGLVTKIDCNGKYNAFTISDGITVSFINIQFVNGKTDCGGAIYAGYNCNININNCTFLVNTANYQGGAVYVNQNSHLSIINSIFLSNIADNGGAVNGAENSDLKIDNSIFILNTAKDNGGAVYAGPNLCNVIINNCTFNNNKANNQGGAVYVDNNKDLFYLNIVKDSGDVIFIDISSGLYVNNCNFNLNAAIEGGAIYNSSNCNVIVKESYFKDNTDVKSFKEIQTEINNAIPGDTIYLNGKTYIIGETICINKDIHINGGSRDNSSLTATINGNGQYNAFSIADNVTVSFTNIIFTNCKADYGGAIYTGCYCNVTIVNCTFTSNTANKQGGAVYVNQNSHLSIISCIFSSNVADKGGAIYGAKNTELKINNSAFASNTAKDKGGAIFIDEGSFLYIDNSIFNFNVADNKGGAIYSSSKCNVTVKESDFNNVTAYQYLLKNIMIYSAVGMPVAGMGIGGLVGYFAGAMFATVVGGLIFGLFIGLAVFTVFAIIVWATSDEPEGSIFYGSKKAIFDNCHLKDKLLNGNFTVIES